MSAMPFGLMPVWRKAILIGAILAFFWLGFSAFADSVAIYYKAPRVSSPTTEQTLAVTVMHGSVRYVTEQEHSHLLHSQGMAGWVGLPVLIVAAMLFLPGSSKHL